MRSSPKVRLFDFGGCGRGLEDGTFQFRAATATLFINVVAGETKTWPASSLPVPFWALKPTASWALDVQGSDTVSFHLNEPLWIDEAFHFNERAGFTLANTSPCARAACSQRETSVSMIRVRMTS